MSVDGFGGRWRHPASGPMNAGPLHCCVLFSNIVHFPLYLLLATLVKFILKHFILFVAAVNGICCFLFMFLVVSV